MNARELKPGFKQTEVGVIPDDWNIVQISEVASVKGGKRLPFGRSLTKRETPYPYIRVSDLGGGTVQAENVLFVPEDVFPSIRNYRIYSDDLYISVAGTLGLVGRVPLAMNGANLTENADKITDLKCDRDFLFFCLSSDRIQSEINVKRTVGAQPKLAIQQIEAFQLSLPPTNAEQDAIAKALNDADALIDALERLLVKKRGLKQGMMQDLLTGKRRLPGFKAKWNDKPFSMLFHFSGGYTASRDQLSSTGLCYLHYGDIHTSNKTFIDLDAEHTEIPKLDIPLKDVPAHSLLGDGDVVFVDASEDDEGASKHMVVVNKNDLPFISGLHTIVAKSLNGELVQEYRRYCFQAPAIKSQFRFFAVGTKVSGISKSNIGKIILTLPPVDEQAAIAAILTDMDAEIATLEQKLQKARDLKQGMMQELLTGRTRLI